jgi:hypothetical protein
MTATVREIGPSTPSHGSMGGESSEYPDLAPWPPSCPTGRRGKAGRGSAWRILGLAALALVVVGGIHVWADVARYMRIRNM